MQVEGKQKELLDILTTGEPYVLIEAPAGTGKTFCCIQAAKCLWDSKMLLPFQKTLILTFSRNARAQLLMELLRLPSGDPIHKHVEINNYHSFFKKYLDAYRDFVGIREPLAVTDDDDYINKLYIYAKNNNINLRTGFNCEVLDDFSYDNNILILQNSESKYRNKKEKELEKFLSTALQFSQCTGFVCFAQFGSLVAKILSQSTEMAKAISHDYPILILDEYQDTNYYQGMFVQAILQNSKGVFFADKLQMIYGFRGSTEERLKSLEKIYPSIKKLTFTEYYRYKDKADLVQILLAIRSGSEINYSNIVNGALIPCGVSCNSNWQNISGKTHKAQCTNFCNSIFYSSIKTIGPLLRENKSIAILCKRKEVANRLADVFFDKNLPPRTLSDTMEMIQISKLMKACLESIELESKVSVLLCIAALCTKKMKIDDEGIDALVELNATTLQRKRKPILKQMWKTMSPYLKSDNIVDCWNVLLQMLDILYVNDAVMLNFARKRYVEHCIKTSNLTPQQIDKIMMQRQYIDSFTNIGPGVYISTIHQSKGKEFDCVFIVDVDDIASDRNLLYVSHSRMKERLYPIKIEYLGVSYG